MRTKVITTATFVLYLAFSLHAQESFAEKVFDAGGKWTFVVSQDKLTGAAYGIFELKANESLSDGIGGGTPSFVVMCAGSAKAPRWVNSKLISPIVLGKPSDFTFHGMQQRVMLRADDRIRVHVWNIADDFRTFFIDKAATREFLGSADARIQFRDSSEHEQVATFSPAGINRLMVTKACGGGFFR